MKIATTNELQSTPLEQIRVVTLKNGEPRCESDRVFSVNVKEAKAGYAFKYEVEISCDTGDPVLAVDDLDAELSNASDPCGPYLHTVYIDESKK